MHWNLGQARKEIERRDIDALVAVGDRCSYYTSGFRRRMARAFGSGGRPVITVNPADSSSEPVGICALFEKSVMETLPDIAIKAWRIYPAWQEIISGYDVVADKIKSAPKPVQYDPRPSYKLLADVLKEKELSRGRIGIDMQYINQPTWEATVAENPEVKFVNGTTLFDYLVMFKSEEEIAALRTAVKIALEGIRAVMAKGSVEGATNGEL